MDRAPLSMTLTQLNNLILNGVDRSASIQTSFHTTGVSQQQLELKHGEDEVPVCPSSACVADIAGIFHIIWGL